nr:PAX-interacting protein 1-like isoform X1 [Ciona intestinalis]|eukprot:XP_026689728.1 PAX-interacting protein 1-like isoform X1 [Ciona intestinalis]
MEAAESNDDVDLFKNIRYYVVGELPQSTKDILSKAKSESYLSALATHVLVTNPDHYEVEAARDIWQIPTVTPRWVELSHKCNTLLPTNGFSPSVNQLFIGFVFTFSNLVKADKASLWSMVTYHGGKCQTKLDKHCTHLVTAEPSGAKYTQSLKHENISIVAPDWITDCIKLNTKCDPAFYHPKLNTVATVKQVPESEVTKVAAKTKAIKLTTPTAETPSRIQHPTPPATQQKQVPIQEQVMTAPHSSNRSPMNINNPKVKAMEMQNQQQIKTEHQTNLHMQPGANQPRFPMQNHQIPPSMVPAHNMMPSTHNYNMMNAQNFGMVNQQQQQQQQMMMSPGDPMMAMNHQQFMMMSPHVRPTTPSPRRGSTGGKKKKNVPQQVARPTTPHNIRPPQHFPQNQLMFSHQMHLQNRMPGSVDHQAMMQSSDAKQNLQQPGAGIPGRHLNPVAMQQGENFQLMQMQQQQQQQQQQMRMNLMHQTSPRPHVNTMDQKWPRTSMDQGFVPGHHQQMFPNPQQQSPNLVYSQNQMIRQPNPTVMNTQPNQISHQQQQYNSMMMNRQVNPQQMMYQQRSPNTMNANRFPTSTSLEAAGMSGISPIALQEGLMKAAQTRPDQPALIHPSLQGTLFPKGEAVPPAGQNTPGTATKKRGKSRKKIDGGEEEVKPRSRQRTTKAKKGQTIQTPMTPTNMMQTSPGAQFTNMPQFPYQMPGQAVPPTSPGRAPHTPHQAMMSHMAVHPGNFPTTPHPPHLQSPTMHQYPRKPNPPMMATSNIPPEAHQWPPQQFLNTNNNPESPKVASLSQTPMVDPQPQANKMEFPAKIAEEPIVPARRPCIDPLACQIKELDTRYMCRDPAVKVTPELCLLGCVFYIFEYDEVLTDLSVIDTWKKMIGKYGGVVENTYTSSCTHVICLTCTTALFRQALMEGKRCVTIYWLNDVLQIRNLRVPWLALHLPTHFSHKSKPATNHVCF